MKTDFLTWDHATLARFAREVTDENDQLRADQHMLLEWIRALILENDDDKRRIDRSVEAL